MAVLSPKPTPLVAFYCEGQILNNISWNGKLQGYSLGQSRLVDVDEKRLVRNRLGAHHSKRSGACARIVR